MRKKQIKERLDALAAEAAALIEAPEFDASRASQIETEIQELKSQLESIERLEATVRANATANATVSASAASVPRVEVHDNRADASFRSFGDFLLCVRAAALQPSATDPRLQRLAAQGLNEGVGSEGGFLVGKDVAAGILSEMHDVGILAPRCTQITISAQSNSIAFKGVDETSRADGSRFGGVQAFWAAEAAQVTSSRPKFREINLKLNKLMALYYATDEVINDAAALGALASRAFAEEIAFKLDDAILRGNGAGQPLGILSSNCRATVTKETSQAAGTVVYENIIKMYARMPARSRARAVWLINDDVMPQLMTMKLTGGTASTPVFLPPSGAAAAPFGTLLGRPIIPCEQCSSVGTEGDIIFADLSQYYLATKGGLQQAESIHVQFLTAETTFRFIYRADGQPAREKPLTPYKGSNTLSPFVTLETRS